MGTNVKKECCECCADHFYKSRLKLKKQEQDYHLQLTCDLKSVSKSSYHLFKGKSIDTIKTNTILLLYQVFQHFVMK
jgi:hypothetical protein